MYFLISGLQIIITSKIKYYEKVPCIDLLVFSISGKCTE